MRQPYLKKILSLIVGIVLSAFAVHDAAADYCVVASSGESEASGARTLRRKVNCDYNYDCSTATRTPRAEENVLCRTPEDDPDTEVNEGSVDRWIGFEHGILFNTPEYNVPGLPEIQQVNLANPIVFDHRSSDLTVVGNYMVAPGTAPGAFVYPDAYEATWAGYDCDGLPSGCDYGAILIKARSGFDPEELPFQCNPDGVSAPVILRNMIINTKGVTKAELIPQTGTRTDIAYQQNYCLYDGGEVTVCEGELDWCEGGRNTCAGEAGERTVADIRADLHNLNLWCDRDGDEYTIAEGDCDDADATLNPGRIEDDPQTECDGIDNDCDGNIDEGLKVWYYSDRDGDGYGRYRSRSFISSGSGSRVRICPESDSVYEDADGNVYVPDNTDCRDAGHNAAISNPGALEAACDSLDNDCDGSIDETFEDLGDACSAGTGACEAEGTMVCTADETGTTCSAVAGPGVAEICFDGIDNDCDGGIDEACADPGELDNDGDGYCEDLNDDDTCIDGSIGLPKDCDDTNIAVNPAETEICDNGIDDNCNELENEGCVVPGAMDDDGDGFCDGVDPCGDAPLGTLPGDCDDGNAAVNPSAAETCNGTDDNCDGGIDENAVPEVCDDVDNDCNGLIDDNSTNATTWYADADADSYGDAATLLIDCDQPAGFVEDSTDCDDADNLTHPGATEMCGDRKDNNCDAEIDEPSVWFADVDGDTFGLAATAIAECVQPEGYVGNASDCDDADANLKPGQTEICDGLDNDCNNKIDDVDRDGDGFYGCRRTSDCSDTDASINPDANEVCEDGVDNDCDGVKDEGCSGEASEDDDGDGYCEDLVSCSDNTLPGDCQDANPFINPGMEENCGDGVDNNCDGISDLEDATCDEGVEPPPPPGGGGDDGDGDGDGDEIVPPGGGLPAAIAGGGGCSLAAGAGSMPLIPLILLILPLAFLRKRSR